VSWYWGQTKSNCWSKITVSKLCQKKQESIKKKTSSKVSPGSFIPNNLNLMLIYSLEPGSKLIAVYQHAALVAICAQAASDHLDRGADFHAFVTKISKLGCDQWTFFQLDQRYRVGRVLFESGRGIIDGRV
jgi:hypothetical protein